MLGRESFQKYDDRLFKVLSPFYKNTFKSKFHKYNRVYGNIEVNTDKRSKNGVSPRNKCSMTYDEYSLDIINNSKRGLFVKTVKFTDLYYKKVRVSDIDRGKFNGIGEYVYSVVLMGFNLDGIKEKLKVGKRYWVNEGLFKDLSEKFEFKESILNETEDERTWFYPKRTWKVNEMNEVDDVKNERLKESKRKWDSGIFSKYEFFCGEEDMDYLLKGIFNDRIEKERIRVWCDGEDMSGGNEEGDVDEGEDTDEDMGDMNEENMDEAEKVKSCKFRVKPCAFLQKIVLRLGEGCYWAGRREGKNKEDKDGRDIVSSDGYFLNERGVLRFDKEGIPLGD